MVREVKGKGGPDSRPLRGSFAPSLIGCAHGLQTESRDIDIFSHMILPLYSPRAVSPDRDEYRYEKGILTRPTSVLTRTPVHYFSALLLLRAGTFLIAVEGGIFHWEVASYRRCQRRWGPAVRRGCVSSFTSISIAYPLFMACWSIYKIRWPQECFPIRQYSNWLKSLQHVQELLHGRASW